jgi:serine/threonine-protein kinase
VQAAAPVPAAAPEPAPAPEPAASTTGVMKTAAATPGRRIFVDQRTVGQTPDPIVVPCGVHQVRVGSHGKTLAVDVPCGGEISVSDR